MEKKKKKNHKPTEKTPTKTKKKNPKQISSPALMKGDLQRKQSMTFLV